MYPSFRAEQFTSKQPDLYPSRVDDKPVFMKGRNLSFTPNGKQTVR